MHFRNTASKFELTKDNSSTICLGNIIGKFFELLTDLHKIACLTQLSYSTPAVMPELFVTWRDPSIAFNLYFKLLLKIHMNLYQRECKVVSYAA